MNFFDSSLMKSNLNVLSLSIIFFVTASTITQLPTKSIVLALESIKSFSLIKKSSLTNDSFLQVLDSYSLYSPQVTALTLATPISSKFGSRSSHLKLLPAKIFSIKFPKLISFHSFGTFISTLLSTFVFIILKSSLGFVGFLPFLPLFSQAFTANSQSLICLS